MGDNDKASYSSPQQPDGWSGQLIHKAADFDNIEFLQCLLEGPERQSIDCIDILGRTAVYKAVTVGSYQTLKYLLKAGDGVLFEVAYMKAMVGYELPHIVVRHGRTTGYSQRLLVQACEDHSMGRSSNPNIAGGKRTGFMTALHQAVVDEKEHAVQLLLNHGADLDAVDGEGLTAVNLARKISHLKIIDIIQKEMMEQKDIFKIQVIDLCHACRKGNEANVLSVLEAVGTKRNKAINSHNASLYTPLCIACRHGQTSIVTCLIENGAVPAPHPQTLETPLHIACEHGHTDIISVLLAHFPGLANVSTAEDQLPVHVAAQHGHLNALRQLLEFRFPYDRLKEFSLELPLEGKGARYKAMFDVNAIDIWGKTPLLYAVHFKYAEIVRYLLCSYSVLATQWIDLYDASKGGGMMHGQSHYSKRDKLHRTHSTHACAREKRHAKEKDGVNGFCPVEVDIPTREGLIALHAAVNQGSYEIVSMLLNSGANVNSICPDSDKSPLNPLMVACRNCDARMMGVLLRFGAVDHRNEVLEKAIVNNDSAIISAILSHHVKKDVEYPLNKAFILEEYHKDTGLEAEMFDSMTTPDLAFSSQYPVHSVAIDWKQLQKLNTIQEDWLLSAVCTINTNLILDSKFVKFAISKIDISSNSITVLPQFLFKLPSLQCLDVSNNMISEITDDKTKPDCQNLQKIYIQDNKLETLPAFLFTLPNLNTLNASINRIHCLPCEFWTAPKLTSVDLSGNELHDLPTPRSRHGSSASPINLASNHVCGSLDSLEGTFVGSYTGNDSISSMSPDQFSLDRLQIHHTAPVSNLFIPAAVKHHNYWSSSVRVVEQDITRKDSENLGIQVLNLANNKFTDVPDGLACLLPNLKFLDLSSNKIPILGPPSLFPESLKNLNLCKNRVDQILTQEPYGITMNAQEPFCYRWALSSSSSPYPPRSRARTSTMRVTSMTSIQTCKHRQHIRFTNLKELNLGNNRLKSLVLLIEETSEDAESNIPVAQNRKFTDSTISRERASFQARLLFPVLGNLDLRYNLLDILPVSLGEMVNLKILHLQSNNIRELPFEMGLLKKLWQLNLENCPLSGPVQAMVTNHAKPQDIIGFLDSVREESVIYNCMNLMVVGAHKIGKTSMLQLMRKEGKTSKQTPAKHWTERVSNNTMRTTAKKGELLSTVGIDIHDLIVERRDKGRVIFKTWDFGGQKEYYATHQYFLSPRALYLVTWRIIDGEAGIKGIMEWLINIQARAPGSHVIIVGTHLDVLRSRQTRASFPPDFEQSMHNRLIDLFNVLEPDKHGLPNILKVVSVSCKTGENIRQLVDYIYEEVFRLNHPRSKSQAILNQRVPKKYLLLQQIIQVIAQERKQQKRDPVLDKKLYTMMVLNKMTERANLVFRDSAELDQATKFLHENGILFHFEDIFLKELYFLDPQWLCDQLAKVVTIKEINCYAPNGVMKMENLQFLFKNTTFHPSDIQQYIVSLLEKFEVALPFDSKNMIIPSMLPTEYVLPACISLKCDVKIPVRKPNQQSVSIKQDRRPITKMNSYVYDAQQTLYSGKSVFYSGSAVYGANAEASHSSDSYDEFGTLPLTMDPGRSSSSSPVFALTRLYLMTYFPSGFWPRIITRLLADSSFYDIIKHLYQPPASLVARCPEFASMMDEEPEWNCWRTGLELKYLGTPVLWLKEFLSDCIGLSCDYSRCQLMCVQEGDWGVVKFRQSSLLEIHLPSTSLTFRIQVKDSSFTSSFSQDLKEKGIHNVTLHNDFKYTAKLLTKVIEHIDNLLHDWYPDIGEMRMAQSMDGRYLITRLIPCPYCLHIQKQRLKIKGSGEVNLWNVVDSRLGDVVGTVILDNSAKTHAHRSQNHSGGSVSSSLSSSSSSSPSLLSSQSPKTGQRSMSKTPGSDVAYNHQDTASKLDHVYCFMVEECILLAKSGKHVTCPTHGDISPKYVSQDNKISSVFHVAPDAAFEDIDQEFLIQKDRINVGKFIGKGAFGFVFSGELEQRQGDNDVRTPVAIKLLEPIQISAVTGSENHRVLQTLKQSTSHSPLERCTQSFLMARQEISILQQLDHPNVLRLLGLALQPLCLVLPLAPLGSLDTLLSEYRQNHVHLSLYAIKQTLVQVSSALEYLHSMGIIYRDLKSENVLVWSFPCYTEVDLAIPIHVKLSDYGISRIIMPSGTRGFGGTPPFIAPEIIQHGGKDIYTAKVDCFSFGMMLYELLTCHLPFEDHPAGENLNVHVYQGGRPSITTEVTEYPSLILDLMGRCWSQEARDRPSAADIYNITSNPMFCHLVDVVSLECDITVITTSSIQITSRTSETRDEFPDTSLYASYISDADKENTSVISQVWVSTLSKKLEHYTLEVFAYHRNKCHDSKTILVQNDIVAMAVVNGNMWCADSAAMIHVFCCRTFEKLHQFSVSQTANNVNNTQCHVIALLHSAGMGEVIMPLANGKLVVYSDNLPSEMCESMADSSSLQRAQLTGNGKCIFCASLIWKNDGELEVWAGQSEGKIAIWNLSRRTFSTELQHAYDSDSHGISCVFLVTRKVDSETSNVWSYTYPGSLLYIWNAGSRQKICSLDISHIQPGSSQNMLWSNRKLEAKQCQVTAMNIVGDFLYVGTTRGCIIVIEADVLSPLCCFHCHSDEDYYIKALLPLGAMDTEEHQDDSGLDGGLEYQSPTPDWGLVSVGRGYVDIFTHTSSAETDVTQEGETNQRPLLIDNETEVSTVKKGLLSKAEKNSTFLLTWVADGWQLY